MTGNSLNNANSPWRFEGETEHLAKPEQGLFSELTQLETLFTAYAKLNEALALHSPADESEPPLVGEEVNGFLRQLGMDLRAGTFRMQGKEPGPDAVKVSENDPRSDLRNRIVQIALADALVTVFPTEPPANPVAWTAAVVGHGHSRVYAVTIENSDADCSAHILAVVRQRVDDPAFLALLGNVLESTDLQDFAGTNRLASVLTRISLHNIDQVLHQANLLGRQGSYVHATCIRCGHDVALFLDNDAQYDWLLPAVQKRLREALNEIKAEVDPEKTQLVDLSRGEKLHFLDHEFRLVKDRDGTARVQYKALVKACAPKPEAQKPSRRSWKLPLPAWPRRVRSKPTARAEAPSGRRFHWPSLDLRWPRWSWNWSLNVSRRVYVVAAAVMIGAVVLAVSAAVVVLLLPKGPQLYPARGQVFYEGKPAVGALVVFLPKDPTSPQARIASALVAEDGSYVLGTQKAKDGARAGQYVVTVSMPRGKRAYTLPARYGNRHTTPLTAIVEMGPTEVPTYQLLAESP